MVWDFDGWSVIINIFVKILRNARPMIREMITAMPQTSADQQGARAIESMPTILLTTMHLLHKFDLS